MRRLARLVDWAATGTAVLVLSTICMATGVFIGMKLGIFSARMDFCTDDTSARYISDPVARARSCGDRDAAEATRP